MSVYPDALPTLRAVDNDPGVAYDPLQTNVVFAEDVNNIAAEILAIATELGTLPKGSFADVKTRLADMTTKTATAQSTANVKAKKKDNALRVIYENGLSSDWTQATTAQNTAYTVKTNPGAADFVASFTLAAATKTNGASIEFECMMQTDNPNWVECAFYDGTTALSGWFKLNASGTVVTWNKVRIGTSLAAGAHSLNMKIRKTHTTATKFRVLDPRFRVLEKQDD